MTLKPVSPFHHSSNETPHRHRLRVISPKFFLLLSGFNLVTAFGAAAFLWWLGGQMMAGAITQLGPAVTTELNRAFRWPWFALMIGIGVGAVDGFWRRHRYRVRREDAIRQMLQIAPAQLNWRQVKSTAVECVVACFFHIAGALLAYVIQISIVPALLGSGVSYFFYYREYASIYNEAKRRLVADYNQALSYTASVATVTSHTET